MLKVNNPFTKIYFRLNKPKDFGAEYYLYDYCGGRYDYSNGNILHITVDDNWSYMEDKSYP